jgi:hypothetical protein
VAIYIISIKQIARNVRFGSKAAAQTRININI